MNRPHFAVSISLFVLISAMISACDLRGGVPGYNTDPLPVPSPVRMPSPVPGTPVTGAPSKGSGAKATPAPDKEFPQLIMDKVTDQIKQTHPSSPLEIERAFYEYAALDREGPALGSQDALIFAKKFSANPGAAKILAIHRLTYRYAHTEDTGPKLDSAQAFALADRFSQLAHGDEAFAAHSYAFMYASDIYAIMDPDQSLAFANQVSRLDKPVSAVNLFFQAYEFASDHIKGPGLTREKAIEYAKQKAGLNPVNAN